MSEMVVSSRRITTWDFYKCTLFVCLHSVQYQTLSTAHSPVSSRNTQMTAVLECISDAEGAEFKELVNCFVTWCGNGHLILNGSKTIKMIVKKEKAKYCFHRGRSGGRQWIPGCLLG